jgi:hypothetical protein
MPLLEGRESRLRPDSACSLCSCCLVSPIGRIDPDGGTYPTEHVAVLPVGTLLWGSCGTGRGAEEDGRYADELKGRIWERLQRGRA